jgi:hypothetical protein
VLSLILWSLIVVTTLKYVFILLRADNRFRPVAWWRSEPRSRSERALQRSCLPPDQVREPVEGRLRRARERRVIHMNDAEAA